MDTTEKMVSFFDEALGFQERTYTPYISCLKSDGTLITLGFNGSGTWSVQINGETVKESSQPIRVLDYYNNLLPDNEKLF